MSRVRTCRMLGGFIERLGRGSCAALACIGGCAIGCTELLKSPHGTFAALDSGEDAGGAAGSDGGRETAGPWACLDRPPAPSEQSVVDVELVVFDAYQVYSFDSQIDGGSDLRLLQYSPLPGTSIQACTLLDPPCAHPETARATTDDAGRAHLTLPGIFEGFYSVERADSFPGMYYMGRLVAGEPHVIYSLSTENYARSADLGSLLGITPNRDPTAGLGQLFVTVYDCDDRRAQGVSIELAGVEAELSFYLHDGFPSKAAQETDSYGSAGFINVREGDVMVMSTLVDGHRLLNTRNVVVRSGATTFLHMRPRAR